MTIENRFLTEVIICFGKLLVFWDFPPRAKMWLFISIIWSNDARLISFFIYPCKLASCRVGRTPCDFLVQLLSFRNGFVFVSACKVTVSTCSWRWLHTQMFPCCVVPPNMVLDKSQMGRGERIVYRPPAWRCYSSIWSEHMRRNQRRTVPHIMTLNNISVLFPFLWFIMLFQKHGATVRSVWWVRKSFQWPRTIQNKPFAFQNDPFDYMQNVSLPSSRPQRRTPDTNLWFSSLSAGVMVFFCFRCSMAAFCFITTWSTRGRNMSEQNPTFYDIAV